MCTRRMPVDICVKIAIPAKRDHLPRGDTLAPNRQCPLVAGTTVHGKNDLEQLMPNWNYHLNKAVVKDSNW